MILLIRRECNMNEIKKNQLHMNYRRETFITYAVLLFPRPK
jgi:hypothetical protein